MPVNKVYMFSFESLASKLWFDTLRFTFNLHLKEVSNTAQKMDFSIKDFFSKCDQIHRKLRICSHLLKKSLMENFFSCSAPFYQCSKTAQEMKFSIKDLVTFTEKMLNGKLNFLCSLKYN